MFHVTITVTVEPRASTMARPTLKCGATGINRMFFKSGGKIGPRRQRISRAGPSRAMIKPRPRRLSTSRRHVRFQADGTHHRATATRLRSIREALQMLIAAPDLRPQHQALLDP